MPDSLSRFTLGCATGLRFGAGTRIAWPFAMLASLLPTLVFAAPPDAVPAVIEVGEDALVGVEAAAGGELALLREGTTAFHVLRLDDWKVISGEADCTVSALAAGPEVEGDRELFVGCESGAVRRWRLRGGRLVAGSADTDQWTLEDAAVKGIWWHEGTEAVYLAATYTGGPTDRLRLHRIDLTDDTLDDEGDAWPIEMPAATLDRYVGGVLLTSQLVISRGGFHMSTFNLAASAAQTLATDYPAMQAGAVAAALVDGVYVMGEQNFVTLYRGSQHTPALSRQGELHAIGVNASTEDGWMLLGVDGGVEVFPLTGTAVSGTEPETTLPLDANPTGLAVLADGYAIAATSEPGLAVLTANPWIGDVSADRATALSGDVVKISFKPVSAGDWQIRLNGERAGTGSLLAEGEVEAGALVEAEVTVDSAWLEGENLLRVTLTQAGLTGHGAASVTVDNPPTAVSFGSSNVRFADGALQVEFDGIADADLERYDLYVSTEAFTAEDWTTGGPAYVGPDDLLSPIAVPAAPSEPVSVWITPVTNGVPLYLAVRAVDAGGQESPMSEVVLEVPRSTFSASELSGETGGPLCATSGGARLGWMAPLLGALVLRRRRLAVAAGGLLASSSALALDLPWMDREPGDISEQRAFVELRYGALDLPATLADGSANPIEAVYDEGWHDGLMVEFGPQFFGLLELDLGIGRFSSSAYQIDAEGNRGADRTTLTWFPLSAGASLRLQIFDEQLLVPFGSFGVDYLFWRERWEVGEEEKDSLTGAFTGNHIAFGGNLLLDRLSPKRASFLEAQHGVNDTYLVLEWRRRQSWKEVVDEEADPTDTGSGLDFTGDLFTAGIKLDF